MTMKLESANLAEEMQLYGRSERPFNVFYIVSRVNWVIIGLEHRLSTGSNRQPSVFAPAAAPPILTVPLPLKELTGMLST